MDRATIVVAALELLNEDGLDNLTTRRLATRLNVKSPALYWHFRNKQELIDEMARAIQSEQDLGPPRVAEPWRAWLERRARERRQVLLSFRDGAQLVAGASSGAEIAVAFESELVALVDRGFTPLAAMRAITTLGAFVTGFALEEQARESRTSSPTSPPDSDIHTPTLIAAITQGGSPDGPAAFDDGLALILDGIEAGQCSKASPSGECAR